MLDFKFSVIGRRAYSGTPTTRGQIEGLLVRNEERNILSIWRDAPKMLEDVNERCKSLPGYVRNLGQLLRDRNGLAVWYVELKIVSQREAQTCTGGQIRP